MLKNKTSLKLISLVIFLCSGSFASVDPTRPPGQQGFTEKSEKLGKLKLQGLAYGENSWVVINNITFKEGEAKNGITVLKIRKEKVLIKTNEEKIWLDWQSIKIKKKLMQSQ